MRVHITYRDGSSFEVEDDDDIQDLVDLALKILWGSKAPSYESLMTLKEADEWLKGGTKK